MKLILRIGAYYMLTSLMLIACKSEKPKVEEKKNPEKEIVELKEIRTDVMTEATRSTLTPQLVLESMKEGNSKFTNNDITARNHSKLVRKSSNAQFPVAVVVSCLDSRIPVEDVFNKSIGDLFVGRIAGNFVNKDMLGSLEFACKVSGAKVIVILGHDHCGAVKGAIDDVKLGNLTATLANIRPVVKTTKPKEGLANSSNDNYVHEVAINNVLYNVEYIRKHSPILKDMEAKGEILIVGAFYDMDNGKVDFI